MLSTISITPSTTISSNYSSRVSTFSRKRTHDARLNPAIDEKAIGEQATGEQATGEQATGEQAIGEQAIGKQASGAQATGE